MPGRRVIKYLTLFTMIEVTGKKETRREAVAQGKIFLPSLVIKKIKRKEVPKGDVLSAAEIAANLAVKSTPSLIPHCHPVRITGFTINFSLEQNAIMIKSRVVGFDRTGFEMEALTSCAIAALTIYDMCKGFGYKMEIGEIRLLRKTGGKSDFKRKV